MSVELALALFAAIDLLFVFFAARLGVQWLLGSMAMNLILANVLGSAFTEVAGVAINPGNIAYACIFFAVHLLLERKKDKEAWSGVWYAATLFSAFAVLSFIVWGILYPNQDVTLPIRLAIASLLAFVFAQHLHIVLYKYLRKDVPYAPLWLRVSGATVCAQFFDSAVFFTIAFVNLPGATLLQAIVAGTVLKVGVAVLSMPLLYADHYLMKRT